MTSLWYKSWLECRLRLQLCLALALVLLLNSVVIMPVKLSGLTGAPLAEKQAFYWTIVLSLFIGLKTPIFAIMLAGSGVNTQTNWGMLQGFHPSMYFFLSLPVTRGQMLAARAFLGAALLLPLIAASHAAIVLGARWRGVGGDAALQLDSIPRVLLLALAFYSFAVFLAAVFDELWSSVVGLALAGGVLGYNLAAGVQKGSLFRYVQGEATWTTTFSLLLLGASACWFALSYRAVRRREF